MSEKALGALPTEAVIRIPQQLLGVVNGFGPCTTPEDFMRLAVELAAENVQHGGGPFGSVIVVVRDGVRTILAIGANQVQPSCCSCTHGEMVAIILAGQASGNFDLSLGRTREVELYTSAAPCWMCWGGTGWSGVRRMYYAATHEETQTNTAIPERKISGFDEGALPPNWKEALEDRGIEVVHLSVEGKLKPFALFRAAVRAGSAKVYNAGAGGDGER